MSHSTESTHDSLSPEALEEVLQSLSDYFIPLRRMKIRQTILGEGGFGTVKLADMWSTSWIKYGGTPTTVAVKELQTDKIKLAHGRTAFRLAREMKVWASCKHENILEFRGYHLSKDFKRAYLVSPYMKNGNVRDYLAREAPLLNRRMLLVSDTAKGLQYLHSRDPPIVHGDLKALNILINDDGGALLSDFGLAKAIGDKRTGLTTSNGFKGTVRYCSPEALQGNQIECPSDMWSWGCLAMEIITEEEPYHGLNDVRAVMLICGEAHARKTPEPADSSSIPLIVLELLRECWIFEPDQRVDARVCNAG